MFFDGVESALSYSSVEDGVDLLSFVREVGLKTETGLIHEEICGCVCVFLYSWQK